MSLKLTPAFRLPPLSSGGHLEDELVGLAQLGRVLLELLVLFDLVVVGGVEQQLFDVSRLQPVRAHAHQDLMQLDGGELQVGYEDGCRQEEDENTSSSLSGKLWPPISPSRRFWVPNAFNVM